MPMSIKVISLAVLLTSGVATLWAAVQSEPKRAQTGRFGNPTSTARAFQDYLYGVIKKLDAKQLVLDKTVFGIDQSVLLGPKTKYVHDGKPSSFDRLNVGDQVYVEVKKDKKSGDLIATRVVTGVGATPGP